MKVCIFGAGAIGGYLAVELALAGHEVSVVARGNHLRAIRDRGLTLRIDGQEKTVRLPASDDPAEFDQQEFVICALKAQQAWQAAALFAPLLGPDTAVVTAMNGIPWWYFYKEGGRFEGRWVRRSIRTAGSGTSSGPRARSAVSSTRPAKSWPPGSFSITSSGVSSWESRTAAGRSVSPG